MAPQYSAENPRNFLIHQLRRENAAYWGIPGNQWYQKVAQAWMDDKHNSKDRYDLMKIHCSRCKNPLILDMAGGCGSFVFYGLLNGYKVYALEPSSWKLAFNSMKIRHYHYPENWNRHFIRGLGEHLPFGDKVFDIISSYQTLEHVTDVQACLIEMIRVLKQNGSLFLHFPDYSSTFEGHYKLPWFPFFYRPLAKLYLRARGRPVAGLNSLHYVTKGKVIKMFRRISKDIDIIDLKKAQFDSRTKKIMNRFKFIRNLPGGRILAAASNIFYTRGVLPLKRIFQSENQVSLLLRKK